MGPYSSYFKPLKGTKTFHHTENVTNKIHGSLLILAALVILLQIKMKINRNSLGQSAVNYFE